jgi:hypothetical protein
MDYAMPRADLFPFFATEFSEVPSPTHPLGIRPTGEGGTTPALGGVVNTIVDALAELGVVHIEMAHIDRAWHAARFASGEHRQKVERADLCLKLRAGIAGCCRRSNLRRLGIGF